ncbi:MAG: transposase [Gammaproteobacteria bacterium]|nr:transposase [Gammaproteobacteria bacterium]
MPRTGRVVLPNTPQHIIQRGHDRGTVFTEPRDFLYYLANLRTWKDALRCKVYAYCLMTNHVHLILDPGDDPENLGLLMKRVAGRQTRYVNALKGRTGSLWEGRYKSSPIETDRYLLACCRYVELNPVRARMVATPRDYPWSSHKVKLGEARDQLLDLDPCYLALGNTQTQRVQRYRKWVDETIPDHEWSLIRSVVQRGQPTGGRKFVDEISQKVGRRIELRGPGRPKRHVK